MINIIKRWNSLWFHKEVEFLILIFAVFIFVYFAKIYAKSPETKAIEMKDQTIYRLFKEVEDAEAKLGRSFLIQIIVNSNDVIPELNWNPDIDYYLIYPNGLPSVSPHTKFIHFDLMAHMLDTNIAIYKGKGINYSLGPCVKPCLICQGIINNE